MLMYVISLNKKNRFLDYGFQVADSRFQIVDDRYPNSLNNFKQP